MGDVEAAGSIVDGQIVPASLARYLDLSGDFITTLRDSRGGQKKSETQDNQLPLPQRRTLNIYVLLPCFIDPFSAPPAIFPRSEDSGIVRHRNL